MILPYPHVHVIINPGSGQPKPILHVLNHVFRSAGVKWDISLTKQSGDAARMAKEAAASGVDLVAAFGGDGTQMEVANGLLGSGVPQAILPGGTGNAMAHELKVPLDLEGAAQLIVASHQRRAIDLARSGDKIFMLRAYTGVSVEEAASREQKDKLGQLAYIQASARFLTKARPQKMRAVIDGQTVEGEVLICFVLNAGSIGGVMGIKLPQMGDVNISDGYLDVFAVTRGIRPLRALTHHVFNVGDWEGGVYHWRGKEISLDLDHPQDVWLDGELGGQTPFIVSAMPQALEIVVPEDHT